MSTTIDNKVVEMRFDNQQFEKNAEKSISTLDRLKQALRFDKSSTKGLDDLKTSTKDFNLDNIGKSVDGISNKFNAMGVVGFTVMQRITNAAIDAAINMGRAFSMNGMTSGFDKYSSKMEAVQVMAINTGDSLDEINPILDKLQGYTDETSYSFQQMTAAMGQFTASGVDIATAEDMVEGIANWAATAGVNSQAAARAFTNLSQAVAHGSLVWKDAQTLNEMNMFTPDFRNKVLEVAESMGALSREGDSLYATYYTLNGAAKQIEVTADNFTTTLSRSKWLTTDVLAQVLHEYADTSEEFGAKAYDAAYEAKTFADAVGAVKDAISTGWSISFEQIFGNYEEAATLWTAVANMVSEAVWGIRDGRNELLKGWKDLGGRTQLIFGIIEAFRNLWHILIPIKAALEEVFPPLTSKRLFDLSHQFHLLMLRLRPSDGLLQKIGLAFYYVFSAIKAVLTVVKTVLSYVKEGIGYGFELIAVLANLASNALNFVVQGGYVERVLSGITTGFKIAIAVIATAIGTVIRFIGSLKQLPAVQLILHDIETAIRIVGETIPIVLGKIVSGFAAIVNGVTNFKNSGLSPFMATINNALYFLWTNLNRIRVAVVDFVSFILEKLGILKKVPDTIDQTTRSMKTLGNTVQTNGLLAKLQPITDAFKNLFDQLKGSKVATAIAGAAIIGLIAKISSSLGVLGKSKGEGGGSFIESFFNIGGLAKKAAILGVAAAGTAVLFKKLKDTKEVSEQVKDASDSFIKLDESIEPIVKTTRSGEAKETVGFFTKLGEALGSLGSIISKWIGGAIDGLKKFFGELTVGRIIVLAFASAVVGVLAQFAIVLGGLPLLLLSASSSFFSLTSAISNWSIWGTDTFGDTVMKIAKSLIYLAGAMWLISEIPSERFAEVVDLVKYFMASTLAIAGMSTALGMFASAGLQGVWEFGLAIASLGASVLLLATGMKVIASMNPTEIAAGAATIIGTLTTLGLIFRALGGLAPVIKVGKINIIAMTLAIGMLSTSMLLLGKILTPEQLEAASTSLVRVIGILSLFNFVLGHFGAISKGFLSFGAGVLLFATSIVVFVNALEKLKAVSATLNLFTLDDFALSNLALVMAGIMAFLLATNLAGKNALGAGVAALGISAAFIAISYALEAVIKIARETSPEMVLAALVGMGAVIAGFGFVLSRFSLIGKDALKASIALFPLIGFIAALTAIGVVLSVLPVDMYNRALGGMAAIMISIAGIMATMKLIEKVSPKSIFGVLGILVALVGGLVVLNNFTNSDTILESAKSLGLVLASLGLALKLASGLGVGLNIKLVLSMIAAIGVIAGSLWIIGQIDSDKLLPALFSLETVFVTLAGALKILSGNFGYIDYRPIVAMIGSIVVIAGSLAILGNYDWFKLIAAAVSISGVMLALSLSVKVLTGMLPSLNFDVAPFIAMLVAIGVIAASMYAIARYDWTSLVAASAGLSLALVSFAFAMQAINAIPVVNPAIVMALLPMVVTIAAIGLALSEIAQYDWKSIIAATAALNISLWSSIGAIAALGALGAGGIGEIGAVLLLAIAAAFVVFGAAAIEFGVAANLVSTAAMKITAALIALSTIGPQAAQNISNVFVQIGAGIGQGLATMITTFVTTLITGFITGLEQIIITIMGFGPSILLAGFEIIENLKQGILQALPGPIRAISEGVNGIVSFIRGSAKQEISSAGADMMTGFTNGVNSESGGVAKSGESLSKSFLDAFRNILGWHSPPQFLVDLFRDLGLTVNSESANQIGNFFSSGFSLGGALGDGAEDGFSGAAERIMAKINELRAAANSVFDGVKKDAYDEISQWQANHIEQVEGNWRKRNAADAKKRAEEAKNTAVTSPGGGGGGGSGKGGGGSSKATEEVKELFDVMKDGKEIIEKHVELFGDLHEKLGFTQPMDLAKDAVQKLAESIYAASVKTIDAETQAAKSTEDKLAEMKEAFDAFVSDVGTAVTNQVDVWGSLTYAQATATKDWEKNFNNQTKLVNEWHRSLIMIARRVSPEFLQEIAKMGPEATLQILEWASLTDDGLAKVEERYLSYGEYATDVIETAMAICAQSAEGMTGVADEWVKSFGVAVEYFGGVANEASTTATVVAQANKKMGDSAIAYARITDQMAARAAKSYLEVKEQVADTLRSQIDLFTKFEEKDDEDHQTIDDMNEAAESNLHAMQKWAGLMTQLQAKGASDGLLQKFYEGGINMMAELEEVVNASEVQFNELNSYFTQFETAIDDVAKKVGMGAANAAIMFSDGFMNNIKTDADTEAVRKMVQNFVDALIGQIEDPSAGVVPIGTKVDEGVSQGIEEGTEGVETSATTMMTETNNTANEFANSQTVKDTGYNFSAGIAQGILDGTIAVVGAAEEVVAAAEQAVRDNALIESPSKLFAKLGGFFSAGLAQGITDNTNIVEESSMAMADRAAEATRAVVDHIASIINGEVNVDPTIRPVLDTSNIEAGASSIDSMLGGRAYSLSRGVDIRNNSDSIRDLIAQTMAEMRANNPQPAYAGPPINMYVYGAEGQSEEEIANIVEAKLMHRINVRGGTWR